MKDRSQLLSVATFLYEDSTATILWVLGRFFYAIDRVHKLCFSLRGRFVISKLYYIGQQIVVMDNHMNIG
jgi:hypothetical protein